MPVHAVPISGSNHLPVLIYHFDMQAVALIYADGDFKALPALPEEEVILHSHQVLLAVERLEDDRISAPECPGRT